jgi:hypothetical protein
LRYYLSNFLDGLRKTTTNLSVSADIEIEHFHTTKLEKSPLEATIARIVIVWAVTPHFLHVGTIISGEHAAYIFRFEMMGRT